MEARARVELAWTDLQSPGAHGAQVAHPSRNSAHHARPRHLMRRGGRNFTHGQRKPRRCQCLTRSPIAAPGSIWWLGGALRTRHIAAAGAFGGAHGIGQKLFACYTIVLAASHFMYYSKYIGTASGPAPRRDAMQSRTLEMYEQVTGKRAWDDAPLSSIDDGVELHISEGVIMRNGGLRVLAGADYPASLELCQQGALARWVLVEHRELLTRYTGDDTRTTYSEPKKMAVSLTYAARNRLLECAP